MKSEIGLPKGMTVDQAYIQGMADSESRFRLQLIKMVDPLSVVRMSSRLLDEQMQGDPETIHLIRTAAQRLNQQIKELLEEYSE